MSPEEAILREVDPLEWAGGYLAAAYKRMTAIKDFRDVFIVADYMDALAILHEIDPPAYRRHCALLKPHSVHLSDLDRKTRERASERKKAQKEQQKAASGAAAKSRPALQPLAPPAPEPWDRPVDGLTLLDDLKSYIAKFFVLTEDKLIAITLWIVFSYLLDIAEYSPPLAITSATKRCGKTFLMELLSGLMPKPLETANLTPAVIFRVIEQEGCNLLIDEFDTIKKGSDKLEEIRGIVNSAWRRKSASVARVEEEGGQRIVKRFSTWAAYVVAAIGKLPDTMADRSIEIVMKRKSPKVKVERLIRRNVWAYQTAAELSRKIQRWANDHRGALHPPYRRCQTLTIARPTTGNCC